MDWLIILLPAFAAGLLVLATHVILGRQVLARGIIFIDLAVAQIAALGAVFAHTWHGLADLPTLTWLISIAFALLGSGIIALVEKHFYPEREALIGGLYVLCAAIAVLLLSDDPHGAEVLKQVLSGQILWTDWPNLTLPTLITFVVLALLWRYPSLLQGHAFYWLFALVIPHSVQLVGVYLVFSSLIFPALAVRALTGQQALLWGYITGVTGYGLGLWLSALWDLAASAMIVCTLVVSAVLIRLKTRYFSTAITQSDHPQRGNSPKHSAK